MAIQTIKVFQNCQSAVEDVPNPQTGELAGRAFVIIDEDDNTVYRFPMPLEVAKLQGQRLMGIGEVVAAGVSDVARFGKSNGRKH